MADAAGPNAAKAGGDKQGRARAEWNFAPDLPIGNNPLFEFPWRIGNIITYYRDYWLRVSEASLFLLIAVAGWFLLGDWLGDMSSLGARWVLSIYALNFALTVLFAGGFHLYLYTYRKQGSRGKYVERFGHSAGARFTFGSQVRDNMFWSLASGVAVWTGFEVLVLWTHANAFSPALVISDSPLLFALLVFVTGIWIAFHFYWGHRLLHVDFLYRHVHSLHHRNVNIGPWSGISMHPVEHLVYFSSLLIHLLVPSHPILVMFHGYMLTLSAIFGHTGFHEMVVAKSPRMALGHFHHQLHHRYFECNYGSVDMPLDVWFGTFHDGTPQARKRLKSRLREG